VSHSRARRCRTRPSPTRPGPPSMNSVPLSDLFEEYTLEQEPVSSAERTRLTIRLEAVPSRWRRVRWWVGLLLAIVATAVAGKVVDPRRSSTRQNSRDPESRAAISATAPHARRPSRLSVSPSSAAPPAQRRHGRHRPRRGLRRWTPAAQRLSAQRAEGRPPIKVAPERSQPDIEAPPATGEPSPRPARQVGGSRPYSRASAGEKREEQFDYLGR
jgi:hypothetical protein